MKTSRQRVLEYVQAHYPVTAADLSRALRMTQANARHHLAILYQRGLLQPAGQRPPQGKGRPAQLYMPSEHSLGHNLAQLASALLELLEKRADPAELDSLIRALAGSLLQASDASQVESGRSMTSRLYHAVQQLNEMHYQARWEAWRGAPRVILGHCPYAAIIQRHPELCRMDAYVLEEMIDATVEQISKLAPDSKGTLHCSFRIQEGRKKPMKM
jgi:predicted ArsR family transcriptional regulator